MYYALIIWYLRLGKVHRVSLIILVALGLLIIIAVTLWRGFLQNSSVIVNLGTTTSLYQIGFTQDVAKALKSSLG